MSTVATADLSRYLSRFNALQNIAPKYCSQFAATLKVEQLKRGATIVRKAKLDNELHFLLEGSIEIRRSFDQRQVLDHLSPECRNSLESLLPDSGSIKASDDCQVLVADAQQLAKILDWTQDVSTFYLNSDALSMEADVKISDDYLEDWDSAFIQSSLAANLPSAAIHQLFAQLQDIPVAAGDIVVADQSDADYFYIIKQGSALVHTPLQGPLKGKIIELEAGGYFGDEALVADTIRNASVVMSSKGVLGRLSRKDFNTLIKQHLVKHLTPDVRFHSDQLQIIDVRLPIEYRGNHKEGSNNIPISALRHRLTDMKQSLLYVVTPANDSRSVLATYLLRQAGFEAYQWSESKP